MPSINIETGICFAPASPKMISIAFNCLRDSDFSLQVNFTGIVTTSPS